jgi:hypothetical protein
MIKISSCPICGFRKHKPYSTKAWTDSNENRLEIRIYVCACDAIFSTGYIIWGHNLNPNLGLPSHYYGKAKMDKQYWGHIDRSKGEGWKAAIERVMCYLVESLLPSNNDFIFQLP